MAFSDKNAIFRPYFELEAIARQSVEASREVICAYFGNIDRNSGYFLLRIFLSSHPSAHASKNESKVVREKKYLHVRNLQLSWDNKGISILWRNFIP